MAKRQNVVYGKNSVREVHRANKRKIHRILYSGEKPSYNSVSLEKASPQELNRLTENAVHQGIVAVVDPFPESDFENFLDNCENENLVLALDSVQDPQNFGTLCRSSLAFGVKTILLPTDRSASVTPTVIKASAGSIEHLNIVRVKNLVRALQELKDYQFWVYGTSLNGKPESLNKIDPAAKSVIVMGSEGKGLRRLVEETCDVLVKIPMAVDFDSLNVAQAGSLIMYDFYQKMNK